MERKLKMDWIRELIYDYPIISLIIIFFIGRVSKRSYLSQARNASIRIGVLAEELEDANERISELEDELAKKDEYDKF